MRKTLLPLLFIALIFGGSCSSDESTPAPSGTAIAQLIAGSYTASKITKGGSTVPAATGTATVKAADNTTASIAYSLKLLSITQEVSSNYQISKSGTDYLIKESNGTQVGTVSGNKMTLNINVLTFGGGSEAYVVEFTK
jgi:hypothetical protein